MGEWVLCGVVFAGFCDVVCVSVVLCTYVMGGGVLCMSVAMALVTCGGGCGWGIVLVVG